MKSLECSLSSTVLLTRSYQLTNTPVSANYLVLESREDWSYWFTNKVTWKREDYFGKITLERLLRKDYFGKITRSRVMDHGYIDTSSTFLIGSLSPLSLASLLLQVGCPAPWYWYQTPLPKHENLTPPQNNYFNSRILVAKLSCSDQWTYLVLVGTPPKFEI